MRPARSTAQFLRSLVRRRHDQALRPDDIRVVLVVELTRLGDALSTLPAVRALASRFPAAHIHLFVDDRFATLLGGFDLNVNVHGIRGSASPRGMGSAVRRARQLGADLVCSMSPAKRNVLLARWSGARFKAGYLHSAGSLVHYDTPLTIEARGFAEAAPADFPGNNIEQRALRVCAGLGIVSYPVQRPLRVNENTFETLCADLHAQGVLPGGPYVVIHPFSGWTFRSWRLKNYIRLSELVRERHGMEVLFLFSRHEQDLWKPPWDGKHAAHPPRVYVSDDLLTSAAVIRGARLFIGNDSGPLHLAASLGVHRVGLFGPSSPALTAPLAGRGTHLYKRVECSPCRQRTCVRAAHPCMDLISVEEVYASVCGALGAQLTTDASRHA